MAGPDAATRRRWHTTFVLPQCNSSLAG